MQDTLGLADWMVAIFGAPVREMMQKILRDRVPQKEMILGRQREGFIPETPGHWRRQRLWLMWGGGDNTEGGWYCAIWSQVSLCGGGCAGQCRVFGSTSDLCPHDHRHNNQN